MIYLSKKIEEALKQLKIALYTRCLFGLLLIIMASNNFGCANMQRPTGGPKDSIPPKILNISAENYSTNFQEKEIQIEFDEFIKLNNQFSEFSISPDTEIQPQYRVRKKVLHVTLPDSLDEETTYTLNFGKGIVDYNEGNILQNFFFVFSTGDELDSLSISGSVKNGFTKSFDYAQDKDSRVILIPTSQDSIFGKRKANIYTGVDSSGNFQLNNLKEDTYRIYVLKEQDNNRIYDSPNESIGFLQDSLVLNSDISQIQLEFTEGYPKIFRTIDRTIEKNGNIQLLFNRPIDSPHIQILSPKDKENIISYSRLNDTANIYLKELDFDTITFEIADHDTILDTLSIRRGKNEKYERYIEPILNISSKVDKINHIKINSKIPIQEIDKSKIILLEDSISRRNFLLAVDSINSNQYHLKFNWKPKRNYELIIEEHAMVSPFEHYNKEFTSNFALDETENYGDIHFTFNGLDSAQHYIIQIIDEKREKVFSSRTIYNSSKISYINFPGGKYSLRIIYDDNNNNRWDPGDVYNLQQPEHIWYLDRTFTIRPNWEQNEDVIVN